jgi:MFS family permease
VFAEEKARRMLSKVPLAELLRLQRRDITLAVGAALGLFSFSGMVNSYLRTYAHTQLGYSRNVILGVGVLAGLTATAFIALSATLCDRVGRRRVMSVGWAACLPWSLVVIPLVDTGKPSCYAAAMVGTAVVASTGFGPIAAFIPELFPTRYRYSATALAMSLAGVAGGAVAPLIAGALQLIYGSWAISLMLTALTVVSLVCVNLLPETGGITLRSIRADDASVAS